MNSEKILLTKQDINELTGFVRPSLQKRWLLDNNIIFLVAADGKPRVLLSELENKMIDLRSKKNRKLIEPNFEALNG